MTEIVWAILKHDKDFLLVRRPDGIWYFPDDTEVRLEKEWFKKLCRIRSGGHQIQCFYCDRWQKELIQENCTRIKWFTLAEMYSLGVSLSILIESNLMLIAYLIQHYAYHPNELETQ